MKSFNAKTLYSIKCNFGEGRELNTRPQLLTCKRVKAVVKEA